MREFELQPLVGVLPLRCCTVDPLLHTVDPADVPDRDPRDDQQGPLPRHREYPGLSPEILFILFVFVFFLIKKKKKFCANIPSSDIPKKILQGYFS